MNRLFARLAVAALAIAPMPGVPDVDDDDLRAMGSDAPRQLLGQLQG